jgi:3-deoxy-D-manno-octulosonic-acid transferase
MAALRLYQTLVFLAGPLLRLSLSRRAAKGREDKARLRERFGRASLKRPQGHLVWVHAASVGETLSVLPLLEDILTSRPAQSILLTTGTLTSARLVAKFQTEHPDLRARLKHQFSPLDRSAYVAAFLNHWQPNAALWVESEIWPNLILACTQRDIPLVMLNGRLSARSFARWQKLSGTARHLLGGFSLLMAQDATTASRLQGLGLEQIKTPGNLKLDAPALGADETELAALRSTFGDRPLWLGASTHANEELSLGQAHRMIKASLANVLTLIAPRHPDRGDALASQLRAAGHRVAQRSQGELPDGETDIYLLDTLGELGLFYRLSHIVLIGGTMVAHGGQNPIEAARLNCAILHGPHIENFQEMFDALEATQAIASIADTPTLAAQVKALLQNPATVAQMSEAALSFASSMTGTRARVIDLLEPYLEAPKAAPPSPIAREAHDG